MQFPVPQFTDVEDKIIGPLTVKQFGILFGVGVVALLATTIFVILGYTLICVVPYAAGSFDTVGTCTALAAGALSGWLWFRFFRLMRQI